MVNINNNIIVFFLLIVSLVMLSHSFIPHDHHYNNNFDVDLHNHCDKDNSSKEPIHCHYFNNIDYDKVRTNNFLKIIKELPALYIIAHSDLWVIDINYKESISIYTKDYLPDYCVLIVVSPIRGSPLA